MLKIFKRKILNDWISIAKKLYIECWKSKFNSKLYLTLVIIGKWGHKDTKFRWTKNSGNKQSRGNLILVLCQAQLIRKDVQKLNINETISMFDLFSNTAISLNFVLCPKL